VRGTPSSTTGKLKIVSRVRPAVSTEVVEGALNPVAAGLLVTLRRMCHPDNHPYHSGKVTMLSAVVTVTAVAYSVTSRS
jgi:hypothetical protein